MVPNTLEDVPRQLGTTSRPYRVAIVGAGPAGFFAAGALLAEKELEVRIDLFDRQPAPYGLVRYGVAPDHHEITKVSKIYRAIGEDSRVRYLGHVEFGTDLTRSDLLTHYDHVVYAVGAQRDRRLGVPGEDLAGCHPAGAFVAWYTGHPDYADWEPDLSHPVAVVVGLGNVALDVARILAKTPQELATTDISDRALATLTQSKVREIHVIARRGPAQAKCTISELKEFGTLLATTPVVRPEDLVLDEESAELVATKRKTRRVVEQLASFAEAPRVDGRHVHFRFLSSPTGIQGEAHVTGIELVRNRLDPSGTGSPKLVLGQIPELLECGLVVTSLGRNAIPLPDVSYDAASGLIPSREGRVLTESGSVMAREYVVGWAKRGSNGVIGTNKADAVETVRSMLDDLRGSASRASLLADGDAVVRLLEDRAVRFVDFHDWSKLDAIEVERGQAQGRPRVKLTDKEQMFEHLDG